MKGILAFLIIFTVIVAFHEYGHYFFGKYFNVLVREFSIGMGPKLFQHKGQETTFTLRLIPAGAYVQQAGFESEEQVFEEGMVIYIHQNHHGIIDYIVMNEDDSAPDMTPFIIESVDLDQNMKITGHFTGDDKPLELSVDSHAFIVDEEGLEYMIAPYDRQIQSKAPWKRFLIYIAGPLNNFILSIVVFILMAFLMGGIVVNDNTIGEVLPDSVASQSGLKAGDTVINVENQKIDDWNMLANEIAKYPNQEIDLTIIRDNQQEVLSITPKSQKIGDQEIGQIGIKAPIDQSLWGKISYGFKQTWAIITGVVTVIIGMFSQGFNINNFGGPVAVYQLTTQAAQGGLQTLLYWTAYLSANLGIVNLIPIPVFDGGRILLVLIEAIIGKPVPLRYQQWIMGAGAVAILLLMIAVTWNDLSRLF